MMSANEMWTFYLVMMYFVLQRKLNAKIIAQLSIVVYYW